MPDRTKVEVGSKIVDNPLIYNWFQFFTFASQ